MRNFPQRGFTLPVILVTLLGLLVLLGALLSVVGLEMRTAKAYVYAHQADLATRSALKEVQAVLAEETANDGYVVFHSPMRIAYDDDRNGTLDDDENVERQYPFLARFKEGEGFSYTPLFSAESRPPTNAGELLPPEDARLPDDEGEWVAVEAMPWEPAALVGWHYLLDSEGKKVARYAYWLEDTEAFLDPSLVLDEDYDGEHRRANDRWPTDWPVDWPVVYPKTNDYPPPWPAPGLNPGALVDESPLNQLGLFTIEDGKPFEDATLFDAKVAEGAPFADSRDSLLAAMEISTPISRDVNGRLTNELFRKVEENFTSGNQTYLEQPVIPPVPGISRDMVGEPQLNLNELLQDSRDGAVRRMAEQISDALPEFASERQGGFHEDYEMTLAANALDYADLDSTPTTVEGSYRGVDSYPMINEVLYTVTGMWQTQPEDGDPDGSDLFEGKSVERVDGRIYVYVTCEVFVELWNMSPHPCEGRVRFSYDPDYSLVAGIRFGVPLRSPEVLDRSAITIDPEKQQSGSKHRLIKSDGDRYFFPAETISMQGNEHRLVRAGSVKYRFDVGPDTPPGVPLNRKDFFISYPLDLSVTEEPSEMRMEWNGELADWARGLEHFGLLVPQRIAVTEATLGSSYGLVGKFRNGNGDIRHHYYAKSTQNKSAYPQNYSPNRRNVRYRIYNGDFNLPYGRVLPSEWPDGGHNSSFRRSSFLYTTNTRMRPNDPAFMKDPPIPEPTMAPSRISNLGQFFSETELGNVFDPLMWSQRGGGSQLEDWPRELTPGVNPSEVIGGGSTLRIGRPEHELFSTPMDPRPELEAARLLDLFHAGMPFSEDEDEVTGGVIERAGQVNLNTAPRDVLRSLVAGRLQADPEIGQRDRRGRHDTRERLAPTVRAYPNASPPRRAEEADVIADAIIAGRPYLSVSEVAAATDTASRPVFGNASLMPPGPFLQWNDPAAEETFARLYNTTTVRSRNFRVHTIGQALRELPSGEIKILSTRRKVFRIFCDPGERLRGGEFKNPRSDVKVLNERAS